MHSVSLPLSSWNRSLRRFFRSLSPSTWGSDRLLPRVIVAVCLGGEVKAQNTQTGCKSEGAAWDLVPGAAPGREPRRAGCGLGGTPGPSTDCVRPASLLSLSESWLLPS